MTEINDKIMETVEQAKETPEWKWNSLVAVLVAIIAVITALYNIKDGNIVQAMEQAQAKSIDTWAYYQAKSMKTHLAESILDQLILQKEISTNITAESLNKLEAKISDYKTKVKKYSQEKEEIRIEAEGFQKEYDQLNYRDDQFDMAEAALSVSIALLGVSALTKKRWLIAMAAGLAFFGFVMGTAGFIGLKIHPDAVAKFLS